MSDIVNDLRILYAHEHDEAHKRAADEIERLYTENAAMLNGIAFRDDIIERLRAENATLREALKNHGEEAAKMVNAEPIGYFCDVNMLTPEQGKRIEQVCEEAKNDPDVFPLYTSPRILELTPEMIAAGAEMFEATLHSAADFKHHAVRVFDAMIAAAPKPE